MWRKESLGVLLWALQHIPELPSAASEFEPSDLDDAITRYGSVSSFRENGALRSADQVAEARLEADAWFGATEGRTVRVRSAAGRLDVRRERAADLGLVLDLDFGCGSRVSSSGSSATWPPSGPPSAIPPSSM